MLARRSRPTTRGRPDPFALALARVQAEKDRRARDKAARDAEERGDEIRAECESLAGFIRWGWPILEPGTRYVHNWHIDAVAEHLEAITRGDLQNLAINIPPGHMKSLLVSVFFPAWWRTKDPTKRFLSGSYEQAIALRDNVKMRAHATSAEHRALPPEGNGLIKPGTSSFINESRGSREARVFRSVTGDRWDVVLVDDEHTTET